MKPCNREADDEIVAYGRENHRKHCFHNSRPDPHMDIPYPKLLHQCLVVGEQACVLTDGITFYFRSFGLDIIPGVSVVDALLVLLPVSD